MRFFAFCFCLFFASGALATTQPVKQGRVRNALIAAGMPPAHASAILNSLANAMYYDTAVELLADDPEDGVFGYAIDTDVLYVMVASSWVGLGSASGILGSNGGTIGNETNNVWTLSENSEDLTLTFATDLVTLASGTSATFSVTPAIQLTSAGVVAHTIGVSFADLRIHDNPDALLPNATADDDDLAVIYIGPGVSLNTFDCGGVNDQHFYARGSLQLPSSYVAGSTITVQVSGAMGRVADQSATLDLTAFVLDYTNLDGTVSGDLVETAAQSINADTDPHVYSSVIDDDATDHALAAGDVVEFVLDILVDDDGDAGANIEFIIYRIDVVISA